MFRSLLVLLIGLSGTPSAKADSPAVKLPDQLTVFICKTTPTKSGEKMPDGSPAVDWVIDTSLGVPLKDCARVYVAFHDQAGDFLLPQDRPVKIDPDISDPFQCSYIALYLPHNFGSGYYLRKVGCPRPILDEQGKVVGYKDSDCPPDCNCTNEPRDL